MSHFASVYGRFVVIDRQNTDVYAFESESELALRFLASIDVRILIQELRNRSMAGQFLGDRLLVQVLRDATESITANCISRALAP